MNLVSKDMSEDFPIWYNSIELNSIDYDQFVTESEILRVIYAIKSL